MNSEKVHKGLQFVLDTSAIVGYLADEPQAALVAEHWRNAVIPFIVLTELYYLEWQKRGKAEADRVVAFVKSWGRPILYPNETVVLVAGRFKALYRLGVTDSFIAAFAQVLPATLVSLDPDFLPLQTQGELRLLK